MKSLKIACTERTRSYFFTDRETIEVGTTDYTDVAVAVVNESDIEGINDIYFNVSSDEATVVVNLYKSILPSLSIVLNLEYQYLY